MGPCFLKQNVHKYVDVLFYFPYLFLMDFQRSCSQNHSEG